MSPSNSATLNFFSPNELDAKHAAALVVINHHQTFCATIWFGMRYFPASKTDVGGCRLSVNLHYRRAGGCD